MSKKKRSSYRKTAHPISNDLPQGWEETEVTDTLNIFDNTELRTPTLIEETGGENMNDNMTKVRRLTPLECERLQGFPDNWTDIGDWVDTKGKKHKTADSPRFKALGNSIALPFWQFLLDRISDQYPDTTPTLGSLFDGIGGFPLCWERKNGKGSAVWASEIEEFPIAVTKLHFPEEEEEQEEKP